MPLPRKEAGWDGKPVVVPARRYEISGNWGERSEPQRINGVQTFTMQAERERDLSEV